MAMACTNSRTRCGTTSLSARTSKLGELSVSSSFGISYCHEQMSAMTVLSLTCQLKESYSNTGVGAIEPHSTNH